MHFTLFTIFPEMFPGPLGLSIAGKALQAGTWSYEAVDIRSFATSKHATVDDVCYGGGSGMVMRADVLGAAIDAKLPAKSKLIYMSPRGKLLDQNKAYELQEYKNLAILCGRYEGIDERIIDQYDIEEISVGDYILSGGEMAALVVMDSCIRLIPGVISKSDALDEESFGKNAEYSGLLEYPLYTRPREWNGRKVPDVLLSGDHSKIANWRLSAARDLTKQRRPDLWQLYDGQLYKDKKSLRTISIKKDD